MSVSNWKVLLTLSKREDLEAKVSSCVPIGRLGSLIGGPGTPRKFIEGPDGVVEPLKFYAKYFVHGFKKLFSTDNCSFP